MDGVGYLPNISFGRIYSTSFFVRTANKASGGQRIGALKAIMDLVKGFESNKASCKSGHFSAHTPNQQTALQRQIEANDVR
ncbi:MAG: hypothetical protein WBL87_01780 [Methanothrix sp.]